MELESFTLSLPIRWGQEDIYTTKKAVYENLLKLIKAQFPKTTPNS